MNNDCKEMRRKIEDSIGCALEPDDMTELERHCAACESCRVYRERLLGDDSRLAEFAAPREESIRRVRERAVERVFAADRTATWRSDRVIARLPRIAAIAAAAAAVIIAFMVIDLIRGAHNGPVPAFAAVQEKIQKCHSVIYRERRWDLGEWTTCVHGWTSSGVRREEYRDSIRLSHDDIGTGNIVLTLYPSNKRAVISRTSYAYSESVSESLAAHPPRKANPVDGFAGLYKGKRYSYVRTERRDGKNTAVYEQNWSKPGRPSRYTIWVDLDTQLPVRMEVVNPMDVVASPSFCGVRLSDFLPEGTRAAGWIDLKPDEPYEVYDDFRWNASIDTSNFSLIPPAGYRVETRSNILDSPCSEFIGDLLSRRIAHALSAWLSLSGHVFPDNFRDMADSTKARPLLLAKFRRGDDPRKEFRNAGREASQFSWVAEFELPLKDLENNPIPLVYSGKGAILGDSNRVICWLQVRNEPCFIIYGNLHIATSPTPPKSARG